MVNAAVLSSQCSELVIRYRCGLRSVKIIAKFILFATECELRLSKHCAAGFFLYKSEAVVWCNQ